MRTTEYKCNLCNQKRNEASAHTVMLGYRIKSDAYGLKPIDVLDNASIHVCRECIESIKKDMR